MALRAVIYDLDGTLVDSRQDLADAVNAMLARLGRAPLADAQVWSFVGEGAELLVRRALSAARARDGLGGRPPEQLPEALLREALPIWRDCYSTRLLAHTRAYPGIPALLQAPPERRAVLTNKPGGYSRAILEGLGLAAAFARVVGGDEGPRKPDPGNLLALCRFLGAAPGEALLVGDSKVDVATGKAAGVPVCAVSWGLTPRAELAALGPDELCDDAAGVAQVLARRCAG